MNKDVTMSVKQPTFEIPIGQRQLFLDERDISDFNGKVVSLRFTLRSGQFYSYWFEQAGEE